MLNKANKQQIMQAADVLDVLGDFLTLKKKGKDWWSPCPFHNEKTASFSVIPADQYYYCHGCKKTGNVITFLMEHEGMNADEAHKYLAKKYNIEIQESQETPAEVQAQKLRESVQIAMSFAGKYYQEVLNESLEGNIGKSYFQERGFLQQTIAKFGLGFGKTEWNHFYNHALKKGFNEEILEKAGLIIKSEKNGQFYDRFRGRAMFPIQDLQGKIIAFGARTLKSDENPKYLNSPETPVYNKSEVLYGIFFAKTAIRNLDNCLLVEGYTDVISLQQAGVENVVASSGTSLTEAQIKLIKRFTENITILYDGDTAGIKASMRGIDMILEQGMNVKIVFFPEKEDPDSYIKKIGAESFKQYIQTNAQDFIGFKAKFFLQNDDPIQRANAIKEVLNSIGKIPDVVKRTVFVQQTSHILNIDEKILLSELNKILQKNHHQPIPISEKKQENSVETETKKEDFKEKISEKKTFKLVLEPTALQQAVQKQEERSMELLLKYGQKMLDSQQKVWQYLFEELLHELDFHTDLYKQILEIYAEKMELGIDLPSDFLLTHDNPDFVNIAQKIAQNKFQISENWEKMHEIFVPDESHNLIKTLFEDVLRHKQIVMHELRKEIERELNSATDDAQTDELLETYIEIKKIETEIAESLGNVLNRWGFL